MVKSKWNVDAVHSELGFSVKHMMISKVRGSFNKYEADIFADPDDLTTAEIEFRVDANSIDTRNEDRDNHLRSVDFFDAENHPTIIFKAVKIERSGNGRYDLTGDLTIRGVTRTETFKVEALGVAKDPMGGGEKAGFTADGKINRSDYGLTWNAALETGGVLVGDEVQIQIEIEAAKD